MTEVGVGTLERDMGCKFGQMELGTKEIGTTTKPMGRGNSYMLMETFTMENG